MSMIKSDLGKRRGWSRRFATPMCADCCSVRLIGMLVLLLCAPPALSQSADQNRAFARGESPSLQRVAAKSAPIVLLLQPADWPSQRNAAPDQSVLLGALSNALGQQVIVRRSADALAHWRAVRRSDDYELVFDEAHFTGYRIARHGFTVLAQEPVEARFAIVVRARTLVTAPADLNLQRIASPAPPALAALRVLKLFPDALSAPVLTPLSGPERAFAALLGGRIGAVVVDLQTVTLPQGLQIAIETDASPGRGFSVSNAISAPQRRNLSELFLRLSADRAGREALAPLRTFQLRPSSNDVYQDAGGLLKGTWGY